MISKLSVFFDKSILKKIKESPTFACSPGYMKAMEILSDFLKEQAYLSVKHDSQDAETLKEEFFRRSYRIEVVIDLKRLRDIAAAEEVAEKIFVSFFFFTKSAKKPYAEYRNMIEEPYSRVASITMSLK